MPTDNAQPSVPIFALEPRHAEQVVRLLQQAHFPDVVDSTMMACASSCYQKFFLEYILRIAPTAKSPDLHAGGAVAAALEAARRAYYFHGKSAVDAQEAALIKFMKYWSDFDPEEDHPKDFVNTWAAVESYFEEYPLDEDYLRPVMKQDGEPAIEFTFSIPTEVNHPKTREPILYGGRFDMLAQRGDGIVVLDEKTTKSIAKNWNKQWQMRGQFLGYPYGATYTGFPCSDVVVRGIAIQKTGIKHIEVPLAYSQYEFERWWTNLYHKLNDLVQHFHTMDTKLWACVESGVEPNETLRRVFHTWPYDYGDACSSYGGCQFLNLCTSQRQWDWLADYEHRQWNPLNRDPTEGSITKGYMSEATLEGEL